MGIIDRLFATDPQGPDDPLLTEAQRLTATLNDSLDGFDIFQLPTVVAGRQLLADTAAMMPMVADRYTAGRVDPTPSILRRPDPAEPYRRTIERIVNQMTRHGGAWINILAEGSAGLPIAARVINYNRVAATLSPDGQRVTSISVDGRNVDPSSMRYIPMIEDDGDLFGESPLVKIRPALEQPVAVYRFSSRYYTDGNVPPYAVVHPNRLTKKQADSLSDQWLLARLENRPTVLSGGGSIETYQRQSAADALLLDAMRYLDAVIAQVLQIPPSLLNVLSQSSLTYSNVAQETQRWLTLGLYPMVLSRIEAAFTDLLPRGQRAVFDTSNLTRMDYASRIATYSEALNAGIYSLAEVRALEGLSAQPDPEPRAILPNVEGI